MPDISKVPSEKLASQTVTDLVQKPFSVSRRTTIVSKVRFAPLTTFAPKSGWLSREI